MIELWKAIPDFDGYEVSSKGRVWSHKTQRLLKPLPDRAGYLFVALRQRGKTTRRPIHQLVLEGFVGPKPEGLELVRHLNGNHLDNQLDNLTYGTFRENSLDVVRHGNHRRTGSPKLSTYQVLEIRELLQKGLLRQSDIGNLYGVSDSAVSRIKTGHTWSGTMQIKDAT